MSRKQRKVVDSDWLSELDMIVTESQKPGGGRHLYKLSSFPEELLRDGPKITWRPFSFKIHKMGAEGTRSMTIIEDGVKGAEPVEVRLGTQPMHLIQTKNLSKSTLLCREYAISDHQGRSQLFIWGMCTHRMVEKTALANKRHIRQLTLPTVKLKRKKKRNKKGKRK